MWYPRFQATHIPRKIGFFCKLQQVTRRIWQMRRGRTACYSNAEIDAKVREQFKIELDSALMVPGNGRW
jgi:hypothetical protein